MEFRDSKRILSSVRRTVDRYGMIRRGDSIAVGLSGGKDSVALLCVLSLLRRFYPQEFTLCALHIDAGFPGADPSRIQALCGQLGVPLQIVRTDIFPIVFEHRKADNPCALCANLRRGALSAAAKQAGCDALALGHHADDAVATILMNLCNGGRIGCFSPVNEELPGQIRTIRPLVGTYEKAIVQFVRQNDLPVLPSLCPVDKKTDRERFRLLAEELDRTRKGTKHRILLAIEKAGIDGFSAH